ncbi:MAG: DUF342 domain-containing protein [Lachnospiraceae bacterium]|nr:DUF342 domain-containing protein [Lachnospiraceae bacterium]
MADTGNNAQVTQKTNQVDSMEAKIIGFEKSEVRVTDDKMEAWLYLQNPGEGIFYTKEELINFLKEKRVTMGLNTSHLAAMARKGIYDREIKIASGKEATESTDAWYEYFVTPHQLKIAPKVREDGSVDYTSMNALQSVEVGDFIAKYHPSEHGEDGYYVDGTPIKAVVPRNLPPLIGAGVQTHPDNELVYIARQCGKIEIRDNKVDIKPVHEISGDVDYLVGKIEFPGDVVISGNVGSGVVIHSERNVIIEGSVEAAEIYAGGDVILKRGIQGSQKAKVEAEHNVFADFIEHSNITAGENVESNIILNSNIKAGNKVKTTGNHGRILGGYVHALCGIEAQEAGNDIGRKTVLHAGYEESVYEAYLEASKHAKQLSDKITSIVEDMKEFIMSKKRRHQELDLAHDLQYKKMNWEKEKVLGELNEARKKIEELQATMEKAKDATIEVDGSIYMGVHVSIHTAAISIQKDDCFQRYKNHRGNLVSEVIVH